MASELLQQVRVIDPRSGTDRIADVLLVDDRIQSLEEHLTSWPAETQVRDCRGLVLGPGLVDLYSTSGEPGFEDRETMRSLCEAACAGGFTRLHLLPQTQPTIDQPASVELLRTLESQVISREPLMARPAVGLWGALTLGTRGEQMSELFELALAGIVGFTDGQVLPNLGLVRRLLEYVKPLGKPVALWPWHASLAATGVAWEGEDTLRLGLPPLPAIAETAALASLLEVIAATGTPVHLMRITTARSVELIRAAKARGLPITASTPWMQVLLNSAALYSYDPSLRLLPPLGLPADQAALQDGLRQGTIDAIAIDHSPYTYEEKTVAFTEAPPGAIGLELALPLLWQTFVAAGRWSALELWQFLSLKPAQCLGQAPAAIAPGNPAELVLFNPDQQWQVDATSLRSKSSNTPWLGQTLMGRVVQTWSPPSSNPDCF